MPPSEEQAQAAAAILMSPEEEGGVVKEVCKYLILPVLIAWSITIPSWHYTLLLLAFIALPFLILRVFSIALAYLGLGNPESFTISVGWDGYQLKGLKFMLTLHNIKLQGKLSSVINKSVGRRLPIFISEATLSKLTLTLSVDELSLQLGGDNVVLVGRMTHVEEWDEKWMMERMARLKREQADLTTLLIEPEPPPEELPAWQRLCDHVLNKLSIEILVFSLRIEDMLTKTCMGLTTDRISLTPLMSSPDTLWATPRKIEVVELRVYCDAIQHTTVGSPPADILRIGMANVDLELPDVFQVMLQPEVMPWGRGKRLRLRLKLYDVQGHIREDQMIHFLYHSLGVFFGGEFSAWRLDVIRKHTLSCRPLTETESIEYRNLYNALKNGGPWTQMSESRTRARLEALETIMSYSDIVRTRFMARQPHLRPCQPTDPRDPNLEVEDSHPLAAQYNHLAAYVAKYWLQHESLYLFLREIDVDNIYAENLEFYFYQPSSPGSPPFQGPLEQILYGGSLYGHVKYLLAMDNNGQAVGVEAEAQPGKLWIDVDGLATSIVVVDERRDTRDSVESRMTPFLLVGPYESMGEVDGEEVVPWVRSPDTAGDPERCNLRGIFKMCRQTKKKEIGAYFQDCRLAAYVPRIRDVIRNVKDSFRCPLGFPRPWMQPENVQCFKDMTDLKRRREEVACWDRRRWSQLVLEPMSPGMSMSGPAVETIEEVLTSPTPLERLRIFYGWRSKITIAFTRCEFVLIEDLQDPGSGAMLLTVTGAFVVDSFTDYEKIKVEDIRLEVFPCIPDPHHPWMPPTGLPYIFPTALQDSVGLLVASRRILDTMYFSINYSLAPETGEEVHFRDGPTAHDEVASFMGKAMTNDKPSMKSTSHLGSQIASPSRGPAKKDADNAIPRFLRVFVKQARLMELSDSVETVGLTNPGVVVTCEGQRRIGRSTMRETAMPSFDLDVGFLYSAPRPHVTLDIVDFVGDDTARWDAVASCNLVIDAPNEADSGITHWETLHVANQESTWWGTVEVQVLWGSRLLGVTIHRLQNIVRCGEERDFHPFVRVSVGNAGLRTSDLHSVVDGVVDIEEDFIFRSIEEEPVVYLSLHNQGRVHDEEIGRAKIALRRECIGEWFWLLSGRNVMGEVKASIRWIHSLSHDPSSNVESSLAASLASAEGTDPVERRGSLGRHISYDMAVDAYHRQGRLQPDEVVTTHSVELSLSPVIIRVTDADLMIMRGIFRSFRSKPIPRYASDQTLSPPATNGSASSSPSKNHNHKLGKRHLYNRFKEFDRDKDGRLDLQSLRDFLYDVAQRLPMLRSEMDAQVERLVKVLGLDQNSLITWKAFRDGLERASLMFEHGDIIRDLYCDELVSKTVIRDILPNSSKAMDFPSAVAHGTPEEEFKSFWELYERETGGTKYDMGVDQTPLTLQLKLVRLLKNYKAARDAWGVLILPALYNLPECRCISRDAYTVMQSPVSVGDGIFVDVPCEIKHMPPALDRQVLTGIRTAHRDRTSGGNQHLTFTLTQPAIVYVCYDTRLKKQAKWLEQLGFRDSDMIIETAHSRHRVFKRPYNAGTVILGGNEGRRRHCSNYFVLVGVPEGSQAVPFGSIPPWLLSDRVLAGPTETLHDHLLASFGIGQRNIPDGGSAPSAIIQAKRGTTHVLVIRSVLSCPSIKAQLLDVWDLHQAPRLTACLNHTDVMLELEHTLSKEWLGRSDRLNGSVSLTVMGQYFNPLIEATEYFVEPWQLRCLLENTDNSPITIVKVQAEHHCNINISAPLVQSFKSLVYPPSNDQMQRQYRRDLVLGGETGWSKRSRILVTNNLGTPLTVRCNHQGCFFEAVDELESSMMSSTGGQQHPEDDDEEYDKDPFHLVSVILQEKQSVMYCIISADIKRQDNKRRTIPPLEVHVHGWKALESVKVPWQGCDAYPLVEDAKSAIHGESRPSFTRTGSFTNASNVGKDLKRSASSGNLLGTPLGKPSRPELLVVEAKGRDDAQWVCDGKELVGMVQFRSNVRLINMSSLAVDASLGRRGEGVTDQVILGHEEVMNLPITAVSHEPTLQVRRLSDIHSTRRGSDFNPTFRHFASSVGVGRRRSIEELPEAADTQDASAPSSPYLMAGPEHGDLDPIRLHPVLFDPTIHDALRRTKALEERSLCLEYTVLGMLGDESGPGVEEKVKWKRPDDGAHSLKQKEKARMMMDWTIAILPPYQIANSLPCAIAVEVLQPTTSARDRMDLAVTNQGPPVIDRAQDLFSFPVGLMNDVHTRDRQGSGEFDPVSPASSSPDLPATPQELPSDDEEERQSVEGSVVTRSSTRTDTSVLNLTSLIKAETESVQSGCRSSSVVIWRGVIESGSQQNLEAARLDRSLYVRIKLKPGGRWSDVVKVPARVHLNRPTFNQSAPVPVFNGTRELQDDYVHVQMIRRWRFKGTRRLTFFSDYWVINKTYLALGYKPASSSIPALITQKGVGSGGQERKGQQRVAGLNPVVTDEGFSDGGHIQRFGCGSGIPLMMSCPGKTMEIMPYAMAGQATDPGFFITELTLRSSSINYLTTGFKVGSRMYADSDMVVSSLPPVLAHSPVLHAIMTCRQREAHPDSEEDVLSFRLSEDAHVVVCMVGAPGDGSQPEWLATRGFRPLQEYIMTSEDKRTYKIHRRFFSRGSLVMLGGKPEMESAPSPEKVTGSKPRIVRESAYFVVLTTHGASDVDIQDVQVHRDLTNRIFCNRRYATLPDFQTGDRMYVDREYTIGVLPPLLAGRRLMAILTAQGDRKAASGYTLSFTVKKSCVVVLAFDRRARSLPLWIHAMGFRGTGQAVPGVDHEYELFELPVDAGTTLSLGANNAPRSRGSKRMYFVLVRDDDRVGEVETQGASPQEETTLVSAVDLQGGRAEQGGAVELPPDQLGTHLRVSIPLFDQAGRDWSSPFNIDAVNTTGQVETPCAVFGVSIEPLPGIFHRTKTVTLCPRFVLVNNTKKSLDVLPLMRPTATSTPNTLRNKVGAILPPFLGQNRGRTSTVWPFLSESSCVEQLPANQCLALYTFIPLRFLPPDLRLPWLSPDEVNDDLSQTWYTMVPADKDRVIRRCIALRLGAQADTPFSQPIIVEEVGEEFVWLWLDGDGRIKGPLISATVSVEGPTVFVTLKDVSTTPPYRIENRSSWATLLYRQQGTSQEFVSLPPMTWHSFTWQEPSDNVRRLKLGVQGYENEAASYALDEVGRTDTLAVGKSMFLNVNAGPGGGTSEHRFHVQVVVRGRTRTLLLSDVRNVVKPSQWDLPLNTSMLLREVYTCLDVDMRLAGLSCNLLETSSRHGTSELLSITVDQIRVGKTGGRDRSEFSIFHIQVDDLRPQARRPIMFEPMDSGWNSGDQPRALPFIRVLVEPDLGSTQVIHYRSLEATIQEVHIRVDLDHIMYMVAYLGRLLSLDPAKENNNTDTSRKFSVLSQTDERGRSVLEAKLQTHLEVPDRVKGTSVMYLELLHHSSVILHIDMTMGQQRKGLELGEDEALATGLELLGSGFGQYVSDIARSFASFHPTFVFNELLLTHFFGSPSVLARTILLSMRQQALTQSYKVVGSLDILGNPISLVNRMGNGVMEFFRKTTAEMVGDSDSKGEGVKKLLEGVVGGAFGSAAKITGTVAGLVEGAVGLGDEGFQEKPQHLGDGIVQGGQVLYKSMKSGVNGLVDRPIEGALKEGVTGFLKGVGRGLVGAVAAPVVGALGAVSRVTESVDASTRYFDTGRKKRRRRRPRHPLPDGTLPLMEADTRRRLEMEEFDEEDEEEEDQEGGNVEDRGAADVRRWGV